MSIQNNSNDVEAGKIDSQTKCSSFDVFDVLAHEQEFLVIQTNAGMLLDDNSNDTSNGFGAFNLALHVDDNPKQVLQNRGRLLSLLNRYLCDQNPCDDDSLIQSNQNLIQSIYWLNQTHSNTVMSVVEVSVVEDRHVFNRQENSKCSNAERTTNGIFTPMLNAPDADAQVTDLPHTALAVMTADCVPIVLYDRNSKRIAAIHAGWQGLVNGIISETYLKLTTPKLDSTADTSIAQHQDIVAWIGASISQECYEVSIDLMEKIISECVKRGMDSVTLRQQIVGEHTNANKAWLNLPALAQMQLESHQISVLDSSRLNLDSNRLNNEDDHESHGQSRAYGCSYSNTKYYSYRRKTHLKQAQMGRMAMLIVKR